MQVFVWVCVLWTALRRWLTMQECVLWSGAFSSAVEVFENPAWFPRVTSSYPLRSAWAWHTHTYTHLFLVHTHCTLSLFLASRDSVQSFRQELYACEHTSLLSYATMRSSLCFSLSFPPQKQNRQFSPASGTFLTESLWNISKMQYMVI